ncbi:ABC transporter A, ABCA, partial [Kipferlia bialata]
ILEYPYQQQGIIGGGDITRVSAQDSLSFMLYLRNTFMPETGPEHPFYVSYNTQNLCYWQFPGDSPDVMTETMGALAYPLCIIIFLPGFLYALVSEKGLKLRAMHQMVGLPTWPRVMGDYLFQVLITSLGATALVLIGYAFKLHFFTTMYFTVWLYPTLVFVLAVPATAAFVGAFFESPRVASIVGVVVLLALYLGFIGTTFSDLEGAVIPSYVAWIPLLGPMAGYREISNIVITDKPLPDDSPYFIGKTNLHLTSSAFTSRDVYDVAGYNIVWDCLFGLASILCQLIIAAYVEAIMPRAFGVPDHPLFMFRPFVYAAKRIREDRGDGFDGGETKVEEDTVLSLGVGSVLSGVGTCIAHPILTHRAMQRNKMQFMQTEEDEELTPAQTETLPLSRTPSTARGRASGTSTPRAHRRNMSYSNATGVPLMFSQEPSMIDSEDEEEREREGGNRTVMGRDRDVVAEEIRTMAGESVTGATPLVRVLGLRKEYAATRLTTSKLAVKRLYMTVSEGECLGLLGPNGAGKTTTVSMLSGLFEPSGGTAVICGYNMVEPGARK